MSVIVGLTMALVAVSAACGIALVLPLSLFPELIANCRLVELSEPACSSAAVKAGLYSVGAATVVLFVAIFLTWWTQRRRAIEATFLHPLTISVILMVAMLVVATHLMATYLAPAEANRMSVLRHYSALISIENLLWPLLLQILVVQRDNVGRLQVLAALVPLLALSPFRAVLLAVVVFGFLVALAAALWEAVRAGLPRTLVRRFLTHGAIALVVSGSLGATLYLESKERDRSALQEEMGRLWVKRKVTEPDPVPTAIRAADIPFTPVRPPADLATSAEPASPVRSPVELATSADPAGPLERRSFFDTSLWKTTAQRIVHPVYQAATVEKLAATTSLPTIADELKRKFRLGEARTLNELVYEKAYGGDGIGQATVLYYGEALAYFPVLPLAWMILVPLALVCISFAFRAARIDLSTIFGIALWRSSLAGAVTIIPALTIQVLAIATAAKVSKWIIARDEHRRARLTRLAHGILAISAIILLFATCAMRTQAASRNLDWVAGLDPGLYCVFAEWRTVTSRIDQELATHGIKVESVLVGENRELAPYHSGPILVEIPYGAQAKTFEPELAESLLPLIRCDRPTTSMRPPVVFAERWINRDSRRSLDVLAIGLLLIASVTAGWEFLRGEKPANGARARQEL